MYVGATVIEYALKNRTPVLIIVLVKLELRSRLKAQGMIEYDPECLCAVGLGPGPATHRWRQLAHFMARERGYVTSGLSPLNELRSVPLNPLTGIAKHELPHFCTPCRIIGTVIDSNQNTNEKEQMRSLWVWKLIFSGEALVLSIATAREPNVAFL